MLVTAQVVGDLPFEGGLQQSLRQLLEQAALARQLQVSGLGPIDQLVDELVVQPLRWLRLSRLGGLGLGHVVTGHRCIFLNQELHRTIYSHTTTRKAQWRWLV